MEDAASAFGQRLRTALMEISGSPVKTTELTKKFNAHFSGNPVTFHAVRKWLLGEAIPTQDKLCVLARLLGVTPEWLRFGTSNIPDASGFNIQLSRGELALVDNMRKLSSDDRKAVMNIIEIFFAHSSPAADLEG